MDRILDTYRDKGVRPYVQIGFMPQAPRSLTGTPDGKPKLTRSLIDDGHSNSYIAWRALGSPQKPTADQIRLLEDASQLSPASDKTELKSEPGNTEISFKLARQGVTLLQLDWPL